MATIPDEALWALLLASTAARPTPAELRTWTLPDIVEALIIGEAVDEQARYHRRRREHDAAANAARHRR